MPNGISHIGRNRARIATVVIILGATALAVFAYPSRLTGWFPWRPYSFGLDVAGGTELTYRANLSDVPAGAEADAMEGLRDVVERRVNVFGVREPLVETSRQGGEWRLIVELAGITDIRDAIAMIGATPLLEFRRECTEAEAKAAPGQEFCFVPTELTGKFLSRAQMSFENTTGDPVVSLTFNPEGKKLFGEITKQNLGKILAIYLDGAPVELPVVRDIITSGQAQISGNFTVKGAKQLARYLNEGALPVPVELISQRTVGATLGREALAFAVRAGASGFLLVAAFMLLFYRGAGICAVVALTVYTAIVLAIFKLMPVTLTLAGIAGFILSVGMAVDANILIFERTKEELRRGRAMPEALREGFVRAWTSIRDSNVTTIITSIVLFTFATSMIKGFALTLLIGVLVSMFSAITVTRTFLLGTVGRSPRWWFGVKTP